MKFASLRSILEYILITKEEQKMILEWKLPEQYLSLPGFGKGVEHALVVSSETKQDIALENIDLLVRAVMRGEYKIDVEEGVAPRSTAVPGLYDRNGWFALKGGDLRWLVFKPSS